MNINDLLSGIAGECFSGMGLSSNYGLVKVSGKPDLGQFQCNGAMKAAKFARRNPREIAADVAARLAGRPEIFKAEVAGAGFVNITLDDAFLVACVSALPADGLSPLGDDLTVVVDYGGPNIAKAMHVGHLRASIIGESLKRIHQSLGRETWGDVHLGDWGLPMGLLISEIELERPGLPYFDADNEGPWPDESPVGIDDLEKLYPRAAQRAKDDPDFLERARMATADLQEGRPGYRALWQHFSDISIARLKDDFAALGVGFELWLGESAAAGLIEPMIEGLRASGLASESQGALVVEVSEEGDTKEMPPLILVKGDGAVMYGTTDLATLVHREHALKPGLCVYVVDQRQALHFEQVFRAARKAGICAGAELVHAGFGTVNGPDGKPFKTREGGVMRLGDLIAMATAKARQRIDDAGIAADASEEERGGIARVVGLAAVKFADLSNHRSTSYVFDLDRFCRFEGRTGPYVQYMGVRLKSLLRKAAERGLAAGELLPPSCAAERALMLRLVLMQEAVERAAALHAPSEVAEFVFLLAQDLARFYNACNILAEKDAARQASWLKLCTLALEEIEVALHLLGIEVPERM